MDYKEYSIAEISTLKYGKMLPKNKMVSEGSPVYSGYRVTGYAPEYMYEEPMLVVVARGVGGTGDVKISPAKSWITNLSIVLDVDTEKVDKYYLCMLLGMERLKEKLDTGAAQSQITISSLEPYRIRLPSIHNQKLVAGIIRTYDDLIENNTRRIKILEEMAQQIYREWFVNFRFPGHEKVKMVESELGMIPEGWEVGAINDVVTIKSGFAFKSKTFVEDGFYGLVTIKNVQEGQFITSCQSRLNDIPEKMSDYCYLTTGDILLSLTGNIGRVCLVYGENYLLNQRVAKLIPNSESNKAFVYFTFRNNDLQKRLEMISTGVAQQNLSPVLMGELEFVIPPGSILANYSEICEPIVDEILLLNKQSQNLRQTRDLLLPKLISGQVDVSELDIDITGDPYD